MPDATTSLQLTILVENSVRRPGLKAEHGLSLWLEIAGHKLLFDTGQSALYTSNARKLCIDLSLAEHVILSHGHYDHGDGLRYLPLNENPAVRPILHLGPGALAQRYSGQRFVGLDWNPRQQANRFRQIMVTQPEHTLFSGVRLVTLTEQKLDTVSAGFTLGSKDSGQKDYFLDEQILVLSLPQGLVVICGCCHPGFAQLIRRVRQLYPQQKIRAIIGGFHLNRATADELDRLVELLGTFAWDYLVPLHCTGRTAWCRFQDAFPDRCLLLETGDTLVL